jgi:hypothetical protein
MKLIKFTLVILFMLSISVVLAYDGSTKFQRIGSDTIKDEFNLKKKNTRQLITGKNPGALLAFYQLYLKEKDLGRADSIMYQLLSVANTVDYRYKLSMISYRYNADAKTRELFLSARDKVKAYRTYFLKSGVKSLKSNIDMHTYYYDLVALDAAYYKVFPDSQVRRQMGNHYNSLAWYSILTRKFKDVDHYLDQSMKYDPGSNYPYANRPLILLLNGRYREARAIYLKLKDQPFDSNGLTFKDEFLEDFKELAAEGITNNNIKKVTQLLNSK